MHFSTTVLKAFCQKASVKLPFVFILLFIIFLFFIYSLCKVFLIVINGRDLASCLAK